MADVLRFEARFSAPTRPSPVARFTDALDDQRHLVLSDPVDGSGVHLSVQSPGAAPLDLVLDDDELLDLIRTLAARLAGDPTSQLATVTDLSEHRRR